MKDSVTNAELPLVSVVMIAYNKEEYIDDAIKGVVTQRCPFRFELIVMDDCSIDDTAQRIKEWQKKYPEIIRYFRNPSNLGLQGNYLAGFSHCRGRYLAICDADDYWIYKGKLRKMVRYMEDHPLCTLAFHRVINYYEATGEMSLSNGGMPSTVSVETLSRSNFITNLSVMYRRKVIDLSRLPSWIADDRAPDYALHLLYASRGTMHFFKRPMGVYRKVSGSTWSTSDRYKQLKMSLTVREHLLEEFLDREDIAPGLRDAIESIKMAMKRSGAPSTVSRPLLSRIRAAVSKLLPVPKP